MLTLIAAGGAVASFAAGGPGENLSPLRGAEDLIDLVQSQNSILWTSIGGEVAIVKTTTWGSSDGVHDLGGALFLEQPSDPLAGTINVGEKPASVDFTFSD